MFTVSVEDHGCGIPPEDRSRVFDRFYRVDRSRGIDTGGTGLGLAIVREVARIHGGDVRLEGVEPSGCRFLFSAKLNPDN
jgi:signal transduction histidine kinase